MQREDIVKAVQVRLDELSPFDDIEEVPALDHIDRMLDTSCDTVFRLLPYVKLPLHDISKSKMEQGEMPGEWTMIMTTNYIKFGEAKLSGWKRVVKQLADTNTEVLQSSEFTMGKPSRPVVVERKIGNQVMLHFFSNPGGKTNSLKTVMVVHKKLPEECPELLIDAIAWQCASDVLKSIGKTDAAKVAQEKVLIYNL